VLPRATAVLSENAETAPGRDEPRQQRHQVHRSGYRAGASGAAGCGYYVDAGRGAAGNAENHLQRVRFEVTDTGIGVEEAEQARPFETFSQAGSSISRRYGGLGSRTSRQSVHHNNRLLNEQRTGPAPLACDDCGGAGRFARRESAV
jgi:hypothetical protein